MAEAVNAELEKQIPELQDYVRAGIFSREEIRQIVKKRRGFEYALRKRQTKKIDFLRYIDYEQSVNRLRILRKEQRKIHLKHTAPSEHAIERRLHFTFKRALLKFKGDVNLWMRYFDFCEALGSSKSLGKAFAQALQYLPQEAELWIKAASWEWADNDSPKAARVLLQRGIRLNPLSKALWREYLRLELLFWDKALKRREILGLSETNATDETKEFLSGGVPAAVHRAALDRIPHDPEFAIELIKIIRIFSCASGLLDEAYELLGKSAIAVATRCERPVDDVLHVGGDVSQQEIPKSVNGALKAYSEAFAGAAEGDSEIVDLSSHFAIFVEKLLGSSRTAQCVPVEKVLKICSICHNTSGCSREMYLTWARILMMTPSKPVEEALQVARDGAETFSSSDSSAATELWFIYLKMTIDTGTPEEVDLAFDSAFASIRTPVESWRLWVYRVSYALANQQADTIRDAFEKAIAVLAHLNWQLDEQRRSRVDNIKLQYASWECSQNGIVKSRETYKRLIEKSPMQPGWVFLGGLVELEIINGDAKSSLVALRYLFETAASNDGEKLPDLWLKYIATEEMCGNIDRASAIYWRAVRTLQDPQEFISRFQLKKVQTA